MKTRWRGVTNEEENALYNFGGCDGINAYNINDNGKQNLVTEIMETRTTYAKGGSKPEPIVKFGDTILVKGKDYTLTYANNTK